MENVMTTAVLPEVKTRLIEIEGVEKVYELGTQKIHALRGIDLSLSLIHI